MQQCFFFDRLFHNYSGGVYITRNQLQNIHYILLSPFFHPFLNLARSFCHSGKPQDRFSYSVLFDSRSTLMMTA